MKRKSKFDGTKRQFQELATALKSHGATQKTLADLLALTPSHVSRLKSGEREPTTEQIRKLTTELSRLKAAKLGSPLPLSPVTRDTLFCLDTYTIGRLRDVEAVRAVRDWLWATATRAGMPTTAVSISESTDVPDGGIDAAFGSGVTSLEPIFSLGVQIQIKTGAFKCWQPRVVAQELFGKKVASFRNLGSRIQCMLKETRSYLHFGFGVDLTPDQRTKAVSLYRAAFEKCGYPNVLVDVWGQTEIIGRFEEYPGLCLKLQGYRFEHFYTHQAWQEQADLGQKLHWELDDEKRRDKLRNELRQGKPHIRLIGEPGTGKTRLALEITRDEGLEPLTIYIPKSDNIFKSSFINELIQDGSRRRAIIVVDDCCERDTQELWKVIKPRSERIKLITLDHPGQKSVDDEVMRIEVSASSHAVLTKIIEEYGADHYEAERWAQMCQGSPRLAHMVGDNLKIRDSRPDVLTPPLTMANVFDRAIAGHERTESEVYRRHIKVLRCVALFQKFGYRDPVEHEAVFVHSMVQQFDPSITFPEFQAIIDDYIRRRIIQGHATLFITPHILQVHLCSEFWAFHGGRFDLADCIAQMPKSLNNWFFRMLSYMHNCEPCKNAIRKLLTSTSLFPDGRLHDSIDTVALLSAVAEAMPDLVIDCLDRVLGTLGEDELRDIGESRTRLVYALQKLAVWKDHFTSAARILLDLAEAENCDFANNATGVFAELFSLVPGMCATKASPEVRFVVLKEAVHSPSAVRRRIGLKACRLALSGGPHGRMVGPEHQGLRPAIEFWWPKTHGEIWDAHRQIWELLLQLLSTSHSEEQSIVIESILEASHRTLAFPELADSVLGALRRIAALPNAPIKNIVEFCQRHIRYGEKRKTDKSRDKLIRLLEEFDKGDFASRLSRYVSHSTVEDQHDPDDHKRNRADEIVTELSAIAARTPELLVPELPWLVLEASNMAWLFGLRLGEADESATLLPTIVAAARIAGTEMKAQFLGGMLHALSNRDPAAWEVAMMRFAGDNILKTRMIELADRSAYMTSSIAKKIYSLCVAKEINLSKLSNWSYRSLVRMIPSELYAQFIELLLTRAEMGDWAIATELYRAFYLHDSNTRLPEDMTFRLLTGNGILEEKYANAVGYEWSLIATKYIEQFPNRKWDLLRAILQKSLSSWHLLDDLERHTESPLTNLFKSDPCMAWDCMKDYIDTEDTLHALGLQYWLAADSGMDDEEESASLLHEIPAADLFGWVDKDIAGRGHWMTRVLAKTLSDSVLGRLTRDFIAKYGRDREIANSLLCRFMSVSYSGNSSDFFQTRRTAAREWRAVEKDRTVKKWIDDYIGWLDVNIDRGRIEEERRI